MNIKPRRRMYAHKRALTLAEKRAKAIESLRLTALKSLFNKLSKQELNNALAQGSIKVLITDQNNPTGYFATTGWYRISLGTPEINIINDIITFNTYE
jgi:hypothetical protein